MSDQNTAPHTFPNLPAILRRLRDAGIGEDLQEVVRLAVTHVGNEADGAHRFLDGAGLTMIDLPGRRRALVLVDPSEITFGRTHEGEQCDESDLLH
ncbi:hypothetical protein HB662_14890 [Roseomonas frigidaquae]|uniref:Uncharacterized protein n=1 Tax=Falsiroseomonas frigidaquae TaxID=487318 RepID=A0ABX1F164_9PROT|nr:hypothetical protein [Falsiroseomonas frigidaquae]NKE46071.1 hypothetical protein [Falsiroseomonas frigidaquae]